MNETYEYAGFQYRVWKNAKGEVENMVPLPNQHSAAGKDRHRRAAAEQYEQDRKAR